MPSHLTQANLGCVGFQIVVKRGRGGSNMPGLNRFVHAHTLLYDALPLFNTQRKDDHGWASVASHTMFCSMSRCAPGRSVTIRFLGLCARLQCWKSDLRQLRREMVLLVKCRSHAGPQRLYASAHMHGSADRAISVRCHPATGRPRSNRRVCAFGRQRTSNV